MEWKGEKCHRFCPPLLDKNKLWRDQIKENRSLSPWGWMVPILKMRRFSCLLPLSLPPEMGEMAQTLISDIEWFASSIKMSRNRLVNIIVPYGTNSLLRRQLLSPQKTGNACDEGRGWYRRTPSAHHYPHVPPMSPKHFIFLDFWGERSCLRRRLRNEGVQLRPEMDMAELRNEHV